MRCGPMINAVVASVVLAAAALLPAAPAFGQVQSEDQQKCINTMNKDGSAVAATQAKANLKCLKDAGKGKLIGTAQDCLTADPKGSIAKKQQKTVDDQTDRCATLPDFGFAGALAVNQAAQSGELALSEDVFGTNLDAAVIDCDASADGCACQAAILKVVNKIAATKIKEFLKCKKLALAVGKEPFPGGASSSADLQDCVEDAGTLGSIADDVKAKIATSVTKLTEAIASKCDEKGVTAGAFPGACALLAGAPLATCLDERVECRVCLMLNAMDVLGVDCDLFDDGVADASCIAAVILTPTPTPTATLTTVPPTTTPTLPSAAVGMTAYRPQTEAYGAPFLRRTVSEADEESPGAGIRINGDDDDGDLTADRNDGSVSGENDLIEVELSVDQAPAPAGVEYVLRRGNTNIKVWEAATKGTAILDGNDESVLSFAGMTKTVWVENPNGGSAALDFEARTMPGGTVLSSDRVQIYPFTSIVIGLLGESQVPSDPPSGASQVIATIAVALQQEGYDVHMYDEDDAAPDGSGIVYDEIVSAIQNRDVTSVAIYGYSHGGGSTYDVAERLDTNKGSIGTFAVPYTAYVDGVEDDTDADLDPEVRLPPGSAYHVNYYQRLALPWGNSVPGANVNINVNTQPWGLTLNHITIADNANVRSGVHDPLLAHVAR